MSTEPISRLRLERLVLGDLDPREAAALRALADEDADLAQRLGRIEAALSDAAEDLPPPPDWSDEAEAEPPSVSTVVHLWRPAVAVGLALAATALLWVSRPAPIQFRGALDVEVELVRAGRATPEDAVVEARPGDRLQYRITADADGQVMVVDLQDDGVLSVWQASAPVRAHVPLKGAAILDDYEGSERVFVLFAERPIDEEQVRDAVERAWDQPLAELDRLPMPIEQRSIWIVRP